MVQCPECTSQKVWKDGIRYVREGKVQRFLCRSCGHRFSDGKVKVDVVKQGRVLSDSVHDFGDLDLVNGAAGDVGFQDSAFTVSKDVGSHDVPVVGKTINSFLPNSREHRVCASEREAKNLVEVESRIEKRAAGATKLVAPNVHTKPTQKLTSAENIISVFRAWMQRQGYKQSTCEAYPKRIKILLGRRANLWNPENVKGVIAKQGTWGDGYKNCMVNAYECFLEMEGLTWKKPRYKHEQKIPFIPLEREINQLIAGCGKKMAVFLQGLKETGADPGELWQVEWKDVDIARRVVTINHPVKGHNPRTLPISKEWAAMLERSTTNSMRVFGGTYRTHYQNFRKQRKRIAARLGNPRILQIKFTSFRHWKGTMEYHLTKDLLHVKMILGHKNVKNTEIYVSIDKQLFSGFSDEFTSKVATTVEEDRKLIEVGFEYVTERNGAKIYRKRK